MSAESTDETLVACQDESHTARKPLGDICAGCLELAERVERLEQQLAARGEAFSLPILGTTTCYWICIGVHVLATFFLFCSEAGVQFGCLMLLGAVATLVVCQVFSTRPIQRKILRSCLSASMVGATAVTAMWLADVGDVSAIVAAMWFFTPLLFAGAWLVAKMFVWCGGWRIVPPGREVEFPKLRIWHFMLYTFVVATYLAVGRFIAEENQELFEIETIFFALFFMLPAAFCSFFVCLLARCILSPTSSKGYRQTALLGSVALTLIGGFFALFLFITGEFNFGWDAWALLCTYSLMVTVGAFASAGFTFLMLRMARYRFLVRPRT